MTKRISDAVWFNEFDLCSAEHLAEASGLSMDEVRDLVDSGVIVPVDAKAEPARFHLHAIVTVRSARRLRDDFELDRNGVAVALALLRRIRFLETELQDLAATSDRR